MPARVLLLVLLLAVVLVCSVAAAATALHGDDMRVHLVQLVHRHGARAPETAYNQTRVCGVVPCGHLTSAGVAMMRNTGAFMRRRYSAPDVGLLPATAMTSADAARAVYSRSTDVLRTLQSASAFLHGFFANDTHACPVVHTVPEDDDELLVPGYHPVFSYYYRADRASLRVFADPVTDHYFAADELAAMGREVHLEGYCSNHTLRSDCALQLYDIAASRRSHGTLAAHPRLHANMDKLAAVTRAAFTVEFGYNVNDTEAVQRGGAGQPFLQHVVRNMATHVRGSGDGGAGVAYAMLHYSTHDVVLSAISATLLDVRDDAMLPPFAQTFVFELLSQQRERNTTWHVRVLRGHAGQEPASRYAFAWDASWQLQCIDAHGTLYRARDNVCPLADFERLVAYSKPNSSAGLCHLSAHFAHVRNCPPGGIVANATTPPPLLPTTCLLYRRRCPAHACDAGYTLHTGTLQCVCSSLDCMAADANARNTTTTTTQVPATRPPRTIGVATLVVAAVAAFCVGVLVAGLFASWRR